jgi:hypothetical protein
MRTIETIATVMPDGTIVAPGPADLAPGEHRAVVHIEETTIRAAGEPLPPLQLVMLPYTAWPADATFRRVDLYGDDGR